MGRESSARLLDVVVVLCHRVNVVVFHHFRFVVDVFDAVSLCVHLSS